MRLGCFLVASSYALGSVAETSPRLLVSEASHAVPQLVLDGVGKGTVELGGPWQFHLGDDVAWASPSWDDSGWEQLTADQGWGAQGHDSYTGFGWYRRHLDVTPPGGVESRTSQEFALLLGPVEDAYEIYWNGLLVGRLGSFPPHPLWYFLPPPHIFGLGQLRHGVLAVRVWKGPLSSFDSGDLGGFEKVPLLGSSADIAAAKAVGDYAWMRSRQLEFAVTFLYLLVVALGFAGWLRDRKEWLLFWMSAYCSAPAMVAILTHLRIPISYPIVVGAQQPMFALMDIALWFLVITLLQLGDQKRLIRFVRIAAIVDMTASVLDAFVTLPLSDPGWQTKAQIADGLLTALVTVAEVIPVLLLARALMEHKRLSSERWLVAIFASLAQGIEALQTTAEQGERFTHWTLGNRLNRPMFTVLGNSVAVEPAAMILLLLALIYAIYRNSIETRRRQGVLEQEYRNARELQQVLVPEELPPLPGFALTSAYRPAAEVGGDFFQIIPVADGATLVILGDVSGKGLKAAMAVALIVGATRMIAEYTSDPAEILAGLNRRLYGRMSGGFATAIAMRLDANGSCTLASAGHPAPFLNQRELELEGALPLGLTPDAAYEGKSFKFQIGDQFALYTDGLLEARSETGELYGFKRLETLFATMPNATQATEAAVSFGQEDDITVLTLTRLATGEESSVIHSSPTLVPA